MGVGIHGEPGRRRMKLGSAREIVAEMTGAILEDLAAPAGQEVLLHVNGFGATPLMELYLLFEEADNFLAAQGLKVTRSKVGNYTTSLDMAGASITLTALDAELTRYWDAPVETAALRWGR